MLLGFSAAGTQLGSQDTPSGWGWGWEKSLLLGAGLPGRPHGSPSLGSLLCVPWCAGSDRGREEHMSSGARRSHPT